MSQFLFYLAKVTLISGVLYSYYWYWLRNAPFYGYNRCYLLGIPLVSMTLPFLDLPIPELSGGVWQSAPMQTLHAITTGKWEESVAPGLHEAGGRLTFDPQWLVYGLYTVGVCVFLAGLVRCLRYIRRIGRLYPRVYDVDMLPLSFRESLGEGLDKIKFHITDEPGTPFSFLRHIFWDRQLDLTGIKSRQIFRHELYHVRQGHTIDILYLEACRIVFWCNPFFHLIRKEIKATHEFMADRHTAAGSDRHDYAEMLVWQSIAVQHPSLVHSFFNTHLKRRITMLTQFKNNPPGYVSRIMILPVLFLLFSAFGVRLHREGATIAQPLEKPLTVVIDAGHGGFDPGTIKNNVQEKDLNLAIAKKVKQFSTAYNVNVLLTRDEDIMAGGKTTKEEGLQYRVDFATEHHADLFVAIHVNNAPDTARGMQVYLSRQNGQFQQSSLLGSTMIDAMKHSFVTQQLLQRVEDIYVLKVTRMPAILVECGNLANPEDQAFITSAANQDVVAKDILQGIVNYEKAAR